MIVADTNLLAYFVIDGARTASARAVYAKGPHWMAPSLWRSEFLNVLVTSVRAGVLGRREAVAAWQAALILVSEPREDPDPVHVLTTALGRRISA